MPEPTPSPQSPAETARRYVALRRLATLSFLLPWPMIITTILLRLNAILFCSLWLVMILSLITFGITSSILFHFPCPRCHQPFTRGANGSFPSSHCKGCGLELSRKTATKSQS